MKFWIASLGEEPHQRFLDLVTLCELLGYDGFAHADEKWTRDVYVRLAAASTATDRIRLGITVTDPFTRHPALTAQATASLAEVSQGRLRVYLGAGSHFETLPGYGIRRPATAIGEMIELIRRLWAGERVTMSGEIVEFAGGRLDFDIAPEHRPEVWVAGRGPHILRKAGELADGVLIGSFANEGGIRYVKQHVELGMEASGRTWDQLGLGAWLYVTILDSENEPIPDNIRRGVSHALWSSRQIIGGLLDDLADDISDEFRTFMEDAPDEWSPAVMAELRSLIPRGLIDSLAVCGTVEQVAAKFTRLGELGVDHCVIWPFPRESEDVEGLAIRLASEVFPLVRERRDRETYQLVD